MLTNERLPIQRTFKWSGPLSVELPLNLSEERRTFNLSGDVTLQFRHSNLEGFAEIVLLHDRVVVPSMSILSRPTFMRRAFEIPSFEVVLDQEPEPCGYVDLANGSFSMQFSRSLLAENIPALASFGIDKLELLIQEVGQLDLSDSKPIIDAQVRASLTTEGSSALFSSDRGLASLGKQSCKTQVNIFATVDGTKPNTYVPTVYVMRGESVQLWWESSEDVEYCTIEPDIDRVLPTDSQIVPNMHNTTTFTITTHGGECEKKASVEIKVVKSGDVVPLSAPYTSMFETFYANIPPQFCSMGIIIGAIEPTCGASCYLPSMPSGTVLNCPPGYCWGYWSGGKVDPGSNLPLPFSVSIMKNPLPPVTLSTAVFRLAGEWRFLPMPVVAYSNYPNKTANFILTVK